MQCHVLSSNLRRHKKINSNFYRPKITLVDPQLVRLCILDLVYVLLNEKKKLRVKPQIILFFFHTKRYKVERYELVFDLFWHRDVFRFLLALDRHFQYCKI